MDNLNAKTNCQNEVDKIVDNISDEDDIDENLTPIQLRHKISSVRDICMSTKLTSINPFDINMIGYFSSWLDGFKKKEKTNEDAESFQEIADYLEASEKIYSCRVDSLSYDTSKLLSNFKESLYGKNKRNIEVENDEHSENDEDKKSQDEDNKSHDGDEESDDDETLEEDEKLSDEDVDAYENPKTSRLMLMTDEENSTDDVLLLPNNPSITKAFLEFNLNEALRKNRPFDYVSRLYENWSLGEELIRFNNRATKKNDKEQIISFPDIPDEAFDANLCINFYGFVADRDKNKQVFPDSCSDSKSKSETDLVEDIPINYIEDHFYSTTSSTDNNQSDKGENENTDSNDKLNDIDYQYGSNSNDVKEDEIATLKECIDDTSNDYSFFNPNHLSNWNGPKVWKTQVMVKALKTSNTKNNDINPSLYDLIEESEKENIDPINGKKHTQLDGVDVNIKWLEISEIKKILKNSIESKEEVLPYILEKWNPFHNIGDIAAVVAEVKYKLKFLSFDEVYPHWWESTEKRMTALDNGENLPPDESVKKITKEEECKNIIRRSERNSNRFKNLDKDNLVLKQSYKKKLNKSKLSGVFDNTLSKDIDNLETDKVEQNDGLQDLNGSKKLESEENDLDDVKDNLDDVKDDLDDVKDDLNDVRDDLNDVKDDLNDVKDDLNDVKDDLNDVKDDLNDVKDDLNDAKVDLKDAKDNLNDAKDDLNDVKDDLNDVKDDLNDVKDDLNDAKDDINDVKNDLNDVKDDLNVVKVNLNDNKDDHDDEEDEKEIDIADLKSKLFRIIDEECVEIDDNSGWSSVLPFHELLQKLEVKEEITLPLIYVGLLHLANEKGLKLSYDNDDDDIDDDLRLINISKPINKS